VLAKRRGPELRVVLALVRGLIAAFLCGVSERVQNVAVDRKEKARAEALSKEIVKSETFLINRTHFYADRDVFSSQL